MLVNENKITALLDDIDGLIHFCETAEAKYALCLAAHMPRDVSTPGRDLHVFYCLDVRCSECVVLLNPGLRLSRLYFTHLLDPG